MVQAAWTDAPSSLRLPILARSDSRVIGRLGDCDTGQLAQSSRKRTILGLETGPPALDEAPIALTAAQVAERVPGLQGPRLRQAQRSGLVYRRPDGRFIVRSPAALALVADAVTNGLPISDALALIAEMRDRLSSLAGSVAQRFVGDIWEPAAIAGREDELMPFLRRGRLLMVQAVASMVAHELGQALEAAGADAPHGDKLRSAIAATRIGVVRETG